MNLDTLIADHEYDPLLFDCPDCSSEQEAYLFVDPARLRLWRDLDSLHALLRPLNHWWHVGRGGRRHDGPHPTRVRMVA